MEVIQGVVIHVADSMMSFELPVQLVLEELCVPSNTQLFETQILTAFASGFNWQHFAIHTL